MKKIKVGIIGAASYSSGELIKLLLNHPNTEITHLISETYKNKPVSVCHNFLHNITDLKFSNIESDDYDKLAEDCDVVFMTKPHNFSSKHIHNIMKGELKIIDLSGDFRLEDITQYEQWYNFTHENPEYIKKFTYGLCELNRKNIEKANHIANPGCYPTSIILGLAPLLKNNLIETETVTINSLSGASGAGRKPRPGFMFIDLTNNVKSYKIGCHQHTPEIEQELSKLAGDKVKILFVPNVGTFKVGIISTMFCKLKKMHDYNELISCYKEMYDDEIFIRLLSEEDSPEVAPVADTNFCDIKLTLHKESNMCVVTSIIDNVIKGASGQAIQNFNIMFGFPEWTSLPYENLLKNEKPI